MKTYESIPERLQIPCLPEEIVVSYEPFETDLTGIDLDLLQNQSGRNLIKNTASLFLEEIDIQILTQKNEKPRAFCNEREVSVSFSHTNDGVAGAISFFYNVGCDMENADRKVHPRLMDRLKNQGESDQLYLNVEPVRIWTLKEAALKMIGTGLRKPMNSIRISLIDKIRFSVAFDDGKRAKICSFQHHEHWISICYQDGFAKP